MPHSAVVKVYTTTQEPDFDSPWQSFAPENSTGSGVVVGPNRILTGAHVIANSTFLQVQKLEDPEKYTASVLAVSHDADLALLQVDHPSFMVDVKPMEIGELPALRDRVSVVGYPIGGEEISVTEGVVSRIEVQGYSHSGRNLLAVTVDAAINDGNSGGPALIDDQVVGIAFQSPEEAENIGELVPAPILRRFLRGVETDRELDVPGLGIKIQTLENPTIRSALNLDEKAGGVLIRSSEYGSSAWGALERGDVLFEIDGHAIAHNGTIRYAGRHRTSYSVLLAERFVGDTVHLKIFRGGKEMAVALELKPFCALVPRNRYDIDPTWFIYGGLVFQVLNLDYLGTWNKWWQRAPAEFVYKYYYGRRTADCRECVVLSQVLADEINLGYESLHNESIVSLNGVLPIDMVDFVERMDKTEGRLTLETSLGGTIVFDVAAAREASHRILKRYGIRADRSEGLS
jgi:S1-C subfamily serine protease